MLATSQAQTANFSSAIMTLGGGFYYPTGVTVDGAGNVYVADFSNSAVKEMPAGCASSSCVTTLGGGFSSPTGVAVDDAGNVYISDYGNWAVKEMPAGCASSSCVATLGGGFFWPQGIAVDGADNVYVADSGNSAVKKMPAGCASSSCVTTLGGGFYYPTGVAVDGTGNVYVADYYNNAVKEIPADCASSSCVTTLGGGFNTPTGVAVDGAGNVYIGDFGNNAVKEMPAGCTSSSCVTTLGGGFSQPYGVAVAGAGNVYVADYGHSAVKEIMLKSVNFYSEPVGSTSAASTLTFTFTAGGTIKAPAVLTQGAANLDFLDASTGTCTTNGTLHSYSAGDTCTVAVTFTPQYAGTRMGTVELLNSSGAVIATANIYGTGSGPQVAFTPSTQMTLGGGFTQPWGIAVDGAGNVYIADNSSNAVEEVPVGCASSSCVTALGGGFSQPWSIAVDGAGNVYVADAGNSTVKEMPAGCALSNCVTTLGGGFNEPFGVTVDGAGNVYVADEGNRAVKEMPAGCALSSCVTTLGGGFNEPTGVAVDGAGNIYVADYNSAVKEMPAGCASSSCVTTLGGGFNEPTGVTVDGAGNVYVADYGNNAVTEMPAGCASSSCVTTLGGGFSAPWSITVDGAGNIYVADARGNKVVEINRSTSPDLSYAAATPAGMEDSVDGTQTVTIANIGNTALTFSETSSAGAYNPSVGANFLWDNSSTCTQATSSATASLQPGASCTVAIDFSPLSTTTSGSVSSSVTLTDNAYPTTQTIGLSGTVASALTATQAIASEVLTYNTAASFTPVTGSGGTGTLTYSVSPALPSGLSFNTSTGAISGTPMTASSATTYSVTVTDAVGFSNSNSFLLTVNPASQTLSFTSGTVPASAAYNATFTPAATSTSSLSTTISVSGGCSITSGVVTMTSGTTACVVKADQSGNTNYSAATEIMQSVNASLASQSTLTVTGMPTTAQTYNTSFTVSTSGGSGSGAVSFTASGACTVNSTSGLVIMTSGAGTCSVYATKTTDSNYSSATSATVSVGVTPATPTINWAQPAAITYGTALSTVQLDATLSVASSCTYSPALGAVLAAGTQTLTANCTPTNTADYNTPQAASVSLKVNPETTATTLSTPTPISVLSDTVTLTASVIASYGVPTGIVSFYDGTTLLSTGGLNASGVATFITSSLVTGSHSITASYNGDTNDSTSATSSVLSETVVDFTITSSGSTAQTILPGGAGTYTYNVTLTSGVTLPVATTVTLAGLPTGATATLTGTGWTQLTGSSWQLPANTTVSAVTLSITAPSTTASSRSDSGLGRRGMPIALGLLLLPFAGRLRRAGKRLGHKGVLLLLLVAGLLTSLGISGCGGSFFAQSQQSYNVTITVAAGSLTHTSNVTLTVE